MIKNEIEAINSSKAAGHEKVFIKIKLNWDDNLPLNKQLNFLTISNNDNTC